MPTRLLCVEDNADVGQVLRKQLQAAGYVCDWVRDGRSALKTEVMETHYDLIVLDLILPHVDGLEVCRCWRQRYPQIPVLMLTARSSIHEVVKGFEIGADDYITKPFHMAIVLARIRALLRRSHPPSSSVKDLIDTAPVVCGTLVIDTVRHQAFLDDRPLLLTGKEFALLVLLARHPGRSFSRSELLDRVWGESFNGYEHTVNTHINRLRRKIETDPSRPRLIQTVWGVGYRLADPLTTEMAPARERGIHGP